VKAEALSPTRVRVTWRRGEDGSRPDAYRVLRNGAFLVQVRDDPFVDEGVAPWTDYEYRIVAVDDRGRQSDPSDPATVRTPDGTPPGAPGRPEAEEVTDVSLRLAWSPGADPESGISAYVVERDGEEVARPETPSLVDERLAPSTVYVYRVRAINGAGEEGPAGPEAEIRTLDLVVPRDTVPPAPPSGLRLLEAS
jgi:chitodextrinase